MGSGSRHSSVRQLGSPVEYIENDRSIAQKIVVPKNRLGCEWNGSRREFDFKRASSSSSHTRATNKMNAAEEQDDCPEIVN
jgi:hypothetical protein